MSKVIFIITLALLVTFPLTKSEKAAADYAKTARTTEVTSSMTSLNLRDQGNSNALDMEEIMNECNETFRIEMSYLESLNDSGSFPDETDRTPKCYIRCVLEKADVVSEDGIFDPEQAAVVFAGERGGKKMDDIKDIATACANRQEKCKCEKSYNFLKCLMSMEINKYERVQ